MKLREQNSSLITGADTISRRLRICLCPAGWLFRFDNHRPQPLALTVVLAMSLSCIPMIIWIYFLQNEVQEHSIRKYKFNHIYESSFIIGLFRMLSFYRLLMHIATLVVIIVHHEAIANVIALADNTVSPQEQVELSQSTFVSFIIVTLTSCLSFGIVASSTDDRSLAMKLLAVLSCLSEFVLKLEIDALLMYICYLGSALGRHVENFSKVFIDSMFDQFIKTIEPDTNPTERLASISHLNRGRNQSEATISRTSSILSLLRPIVSGFNEMYRRLTLTHYPELPEMKMTKLSTTTELKVTSSIRESNTRLTRLRLRRTQVMLSELRDMVGDINKISSPIIMMQVLYQTALIVLITTASIHLKIYKSFNLLIIPTVSSVVGLLILVAHICTSLDDTTKQLKLMINKIFDFIIMNHGAKISDKESCDSTDLLNLTSNEDSLSETWAQFQYTRKLANTIQFTMGGVLPVSRRLIISILGHVLSAVFISMEIMSIIDTSQDH